MSSEVRDNGAVGERGVCFAKERERANRAEDGLEQIKNGICVLKTEYNRSHVAVANKPLQQDPEELDAGSVRGGSPLLVLLVKAQLDGNGVDGPRDCTVPVKQVDRVQDLRPS